MIKRFLTMLCAVAAIALGSVAPAHAVANDMYHAAGDPGYNAPIHIVCDYSNRHVYLGLGEVASWYCGVNGVGRIITDAHQEVRCTNSAAPFLPVTYPAGTVSAVQPYSSLRCYSRWVGSARRLFG